MATGCGDVLSLEDLKIAKLHQLFEAEVITGRQGGVATGAEIDYATNQVTGQTQKTLPAVLRDAGFLPASFDFSTGGILSTSDRNKAVYDPVSRTWYSYKGSLPVTIPAGFNPVGNANWSPINDDSWRGELAANSGASMIGTSSGATVQQSLDSLTPRFDFLSGSNLNAGFTKQYVLGVTDREGEAAAAIKADAGRTDGAFPQGIAVDPVTDEILITRGWEANTPTYVHIYDKNMVFKAVVKAGGGFSEGIIIGYVNGERRIALSRAGTGYSVYTLPATEQIGSLYAATLLFEQTSSNHLSQINSFGNYALMVLNTNSFDQYFRRGTASVFSLQDVLTTPDPVRVTWVSFPFYTTGSGVSDNPNNNGAVVPKGQAICLSPRGVAAYAGAMWSSAIAARDLPGDTLEFTEVSHTGGVINSQNLYPKYVLQEYARKGWTRPNGNALDNTEAEGLTYSTKHGYVYLTVVSERVFVTVSQNATQSDTSKQLDFTGAVKPNVSAASGLSTVNTIVGYNTIDGTTMANIDAIIDYTRYMAITEYSLTCRLPITIGTETISGVFNHIHILNIDGINTVVTVTRDRAQVRKYYTSSASAPRTFTSSPWQFEGSVSTLDMNGRTSMVTIGSDGTGQVAITRAPGSVGSHTGLRFNIQNGAELGSVVLGTSGTTYNTTSDVRRKNDHGEITGALDILEEMVNNQAFRMASFKSEPGKIIPMLMAQHLNKTAPYAVTEGGEDEQSEPWMVDPSKLVPLLLAMIYELKQKIK